MRFSNTQRRLLLEAMWTGSTPLFDHELPAARRLAKRHFGRIFWKRCAGFAINQRGIAAADKLSEPERLEAGAML